MANSIVEKLLEARKQLLDLTARNRLLNTPRSFRRTKRLDIVDERTEQIFSHLVVDKKSMSFLAAEKMESEDEDEASEGDGT